MDGGQPETPPETVGAKQPETTTEKHPETIVPQPSQAVTFEWETAGNSRPETPLETVVGKQPETVPETTKETKIVSAKGEDVSKWRKYAVTYYARSILPVTDDPKKRKSQLATRQRNRGEYEHWRDLLLAAGFKVIEGAKKLTIIEPNEK